jgi:hypothetical protein
VLVAAKRTLESEDRSETIGRQGKASEPLAKGGPAKMAPSLTALNINDEIRRSTWFETGGAPPGYGSTDNALVITHASGPGPRAIKRPWSITVDGAYTTQF